MGNEIDDDGDEEEEVEYVCVRVSMFARTIFFIVTVAHGRMVVARYSQNRNENANSVKMKRNAEKKHEAKAIYTLARV